MNSIKDAEGSRLDGSFSRQRGFRNKFKKYGPSRTFQGETFQKKRGRLWPWNGTMWMSFWLNLADRVHDTFYRFCSTIVSFNISAPKPTVSNWKPFGWWCMSISILHYLVRAQDIKLKNYCTSVLYAGNMLYIHIKNKHNKLLFRLATSDLQTDTSLMFSEIYHNLI